jgi:hypothetical protein
MLFIWLAFQGIALAAPVALAVAGSAPVEELCTCPGGDHETCPMHHGQKANSPISAVCGMRSLGAPTDVALLSMAGGLGLVPEFFAITPQLRSSTIPPGERRVLDVSIPHDTPPPRL